MDRKHITQQIRAQMKQITSAFIAEYEKQLIQKEFQKQRLKQKVMIEILSNRHKKQSTTEGSAKQTSRVQKFSRKDELNHLPIKKVIEANANLMDDYHYPSDRFIPRKTQQLNSLIMRSNSLPNDERELIKVSLTDRKQEDSQPQAVQIAQITFNQKQNLSQKLSLNSQLRNSKLSHAQSNGSKVENSGTFRNLKKAVNEQPEDAQQKQQLHHHLNEQPSDQKYEGEQQQEQQDNDDNNSENNRVADNGRSEHQPQQVPSQEDKTCEKGVFLTLEENESQFQQPQQKHGSYAFDILMEKSELNQDIEELRKKKILEMEKKRAMRMEQNKKNQQSRKSQLPPRNNTKGKGQYGRKSFKTIRDATDEEDNQTLQSNPPPINNNNNNNNNNNSRKNQRPSSKSNLQTNPLELNQTTYSNLRNENSRVSRQLENNNQRHSPAHTPKSAVSSNRNKATKSNLFAADSPGRQKSNSKHLNQPKIQPKGTKNVFSKQSNRKLMITAITYVCLPGELNRKQRQRLIQVIQNEESSEFFIFLFKQYSRKVIKGIYILDPPQEKIRKIYGDKAAPQLYSEQVHEFYRFDSGSREFKKLDGCKSFSLAVHAIDLK